MESVATWEDGTTAIAQVQRGKGRFILLGTPFFLRFRDENGAWLNEAERQLLFQELLANLKVELDTQSSESQVWLEHRVSKNGLYDVFMSGAMGVRGKDWKLSDRITSHLRIKSPAKAPLIEAQAPGMPDIPAQQKAEWKDLGAQTFAPYQIRQFASVRPNAGLDGPTRRRAPERPSPANWGWTA
jgi:hypothetical protein